MGYLPILLCLDNTGKVTTSCKVGKLKQESGKTVKESSGSSEQKNRNEHNNLECSCHIC